VKADLRLEWANFLSEQPWDFFLTVTFKDPLPLDRAEKVMHSVYKTLHRRCKPAMVFLGAEPHVSRLIHLHGLYKGCGGPQGRCAGLGRPHGIEDPSDVWLPLFEIFGRSKVEIPRGKDAITRYVSKYCVKWCEIYNLYTDP